MRSTSKPLGAALALTFSLLVACGGAGDSNKVSTVSTTTVNEDALAASILITLSDLPAGWAEELVSDDEDDPYEECDRGDPAGRTGRAGTGDFSRGGSATFSSSVGVFESPDAALVAVSALLDRVTCAASVINSGGLNTDEFEFSEASVSRLHLPDIEHRIEAFRLTAFVKSKTETGLGSSGNVHLDIIAVGVGRFGTSIETFDVFSPFDTELLETLVNIAVERASAMTEALASQ